MMLDLRRGARWSLLASLLFVAWLSLQQSAGVPWFSGQDKVLHMAAYTVFYALGALGWERPTWRLPALLFAYGVGIELLQAGVPGRVTSAGDLFANGIGLVIGALWMKGRQRSRTVAVSR